MALVNTYSLPIVWGIGDTFAKVANDSYFVKHGATAHILISMSSPYKTVQLQHMRRRRYKPSYVAAHSGMDQTASEVWEPWPDAWSGDGIDSGQTYRTMTGDGNDKTVELASIVDDYDTGDFDGIEYRARVRIYNSGDGAFSEWVERVFFVGYLPHVTAATFDTSAEGVRVSFTSNATRDYSAYMVEGKGANPYRFTFAPDNPVYVSRGLAPLDAETISFDAALSYGCTFDASLVSNGRVTLSRGIAPSAVTNPIIAYTKGVRLGVSIRATTGVYSDVDVCAKWTGADGSERFIEVQADYSAPFWSVSLEVPFDTPIELVYKITAGSRYKLFTATETLPGWRKVWLTHDDVAIALAYDLEDTSPFNMDADTIKPAGASRPLSRYGQGGRREYTLNATIEAEDSAIIYQLQEPTDWTLRAYGDMRRVTVRSVTPTRKQGLGEKLITLAILVEEVG